MTRIITSAILALIASPALALNIVLTNDDGFETANIQALFDALVEAGHSVIMTAPYSGQSGTGGKVDFLQPIPPTAEASPEGTLPEGSFGVGATTIAPLQFYVDGTPTASVLYGIDIKAIETWNRFPDLVISGPNEGNNLGLVTPHSGTLGAAVTALNKGIPAIAVSADNGESDQAAIVADIVLRIVDAIDGRKGVRLPRNTGLNVNIPPIDAATMTADDFKLKTTRVGRASSIGLQFFEKLGESPIAQLFGIPPETSLPGVSVAIPYTDAGYPEDTSRRSEGNALGDRVVTVSPIQGTYASDRVIEGRIRGLLEGRAKRDDDDDDDD